MSGEAPTQTLEVPSGDGTEAPAQRGLIGRTLGRFTVVDRLGFGGSSEVFRAEEIALSRSVVIKVLRDRAHGSVNQIERFLREAKLASKLDHPYAAHIYAFGAEPDQLLWIAMEHVKGSTLDALVRRRGPMPPAVFAPLFGRLCEVIHSAHELGIVHRDVKGNNVMVIERSGQLLPKLLDFGIAKGGGTPYVEVEGSGGPELTQEGATIGTPNYMSPEQWQNPADVDFRADIYALGVLAYHCLSGRFPFAGADRTKIKLAHLYDEPPPLPEVAPELARVVMRALAKAAADRWSDALAFGDSVRAAAGSSASEAVPIFDPETGEAWLTGGPQPIADAVARLAGANTTIEADAALRELVAITCRWLAVLALSGVTMFDEAISACARNVVGRETSAPWVRLARAAAVGSTLAGLEASLVGIEPLVALAERLDEREGPRTASALAIDVVAAAEALRALEPLLAYQLVVGRSEGAESWQGRRRRERERVVVWGEPLAAAEVALIDGTGRVVARLSPLVQVIEPWPSQEPELFLLWRTGRGSARLVAAPWGFERDDASVGERLAELSSVDSETANDLAEESPYPGLAAYAMADADRFVGREREVEILVNRLVRAPMVAVLGPSGVGKSSFIHAGLLPRLAEHYRIVTLRPGRHPMHALRTAVAATDDDEILDKLRALGEQSPRGVVLAIDQLEELSTLCNDPDERNAFADLLATAAHSSRAAVRIVVTLRDDFATVIESAVAFRGRFEVFVLATPPPEVLRKIITDPLRRAGVTIDPRVVEDVVAEVAGRPASLPLLAFTVTRLWQTRDRAAARIDHAAYTALDGVAGALSMYAEEVYGGLSRRDQEVVRDLFSRLVAPDGTRIPAPRAELDQLLDAKTVVDRLVDARLLVARDDDDVDAIEIVHECLAERWTRLARWRSEDAADRELLGDVSNAARRWHDQGRPPDALWRGAALDELRQLAARSTALTPIERAFADEAHRAAGRTRSLRRGLWFGTMGVLAAIAIVMASLGIAAKQSATAARDAAKLAEDRLTASLIAQSRSELGDGRAIQSLAYLGAAMRRGADSTGLRTMFSIASRGWRDELAHATGVSSIDVDVDGARLAAGDRDGVVRWWSSDGTPLGELAAAIGPIDSVLSGSGDRLAATGHDGIAVIDSRARTVVATFAIPVWHWAVHPGPADDEVTVLGHSGLEVYGFDGTPRRSATGGFTGTISPVFDRSGRHLFAFFSGRISVIDLVTMTERELTRTAAHPPATSTDGRTRGYLDASGTLVLLDDEGRVTRSIETGGHPDQLAFSPNGDRFVIVTGRDAAIYRTDGTLDHRLRIEDAATVAIRGDEVWTADRQGVIRHYRGSLLVASIPGHVAAAETLRLAGDVIATVATDSSLILVRASAIQLRDAATPCPSMQRGPVGIGMVYGCAPDGQLVFVGARQVSQFASSHLVHGIAFDDGSQRVAFGTEDQALVLGRDGSEVATIAMSPPLIASAFEDPDHLIVVTRDGVARWPLAQRQLAPILVGTDATSVAVGVGGLFVGYNDGHLGIIRGDRELLGTALGQRIEYLVASPDRRWVVATLASGGADVLDGETGNLVRALEPTGQTGAATQFDATGDLLLRGGAVLSIWERATGDRLVSNLDLMRASLVGRFAPDGRIETGEGIVELPRDTRPLSILIQDIDCHVPVRATGARLEPVQRLPCR